MTIFGIDISEHQDGLSLKRARAEGIEFVIVRTTDGTYKDRCYASHVEDAEAAGMLISAYHYLRAPKEGTTIPQQVEASIQVMGAKRYPIWIDVESPAGLTGEDVRACKREFEARGVQVIGVYTYVPYWENMPGGEPNMTGLGALWVAAYGRNPTGRPSTIYPGDGASQWDYQLGDCKPLLWQYGSRGQVAAYEVDVNAYRGTREELARLFQGTQERTQTVDVILGYDRAHVKQDTYYWCGPATAQTIINARDRRLIPESQLAREMGTHTGGTDHIGLVQHALDQYLPGAGYEVVLMPNDPPSTAQIEALWRNLKASIDAGYGVAANIVAPPSNYPRPSHTSTQALAYGGGTVYHYVAFMGYAVDAHGGRHVWWADSGFAPHGCWVSLEQTASLIPPKGYAYSTAAPITINEEDEDMSISSDNQIQLRGPGLNGWDPVWLVEQAEKRGGKATMVEMLAQVLTEVRELRKEVEKMKS